MTTPSALRQELISKGIIPEGKSNNCVLWDWFKAVMDLQQEFRVTTKNKKKLEKLICLGCVFDDCEKGEYL